MNDSPVEPSWTAEESLVIMNFLEESQGAFNHLDVKMIKVLYSVHLAGYWRGKAAERQELFRMIQLRGER